MTTVSQGKHPQTLVRAYSPRLRQTRRSCDGCESVSDSFLPPPHRSLILYGMHQPYTGPDSPNKLVCVPRYRKDEISGTQQPPTKLMSFSGPATFCIDCEAGKFSTAASHRCSTLCLLSGILLPRMYDVAAASLSSPSRLVYFV